MGQGSNETKITLPASSRFSWRSDFGKWSDEYRTVVYSVWYMNGKPTANPLHELIPENENGTKPTIYTLENWIEEEFIEAALVTDEKAMATLHNDLASGKVEMLERHAKIGQQMQDLAVQYFKTHDISTLKARDAILMLVKGIEIERESRYPQEKEFSKIAEMTTDELISKLEEEAKRVIIDVEPAEE